MVHLANVLTKRIKLLELPKAIQDDLIRHRIKTSIAEELTFVKDKEEQSKLAQLVMTRHVTVKKLRELTSNKSTQESAYDQLTSNPETGKDILANFDKSVIALRLALNRLSDIIVALDDEWFLQELIQQERSVLHSQIDLLIKQKKKYTTFSTCISS